MKTKVITKDLKRITTNHASIRKLIVPKHKGDNMVKIIIRDENLTVGDYIDVQYSSQDFDDWLSISDYQRSIFVVKQRIKLQEYDVDTDGSVLLCASLTFPLERHILGIDVELIQRNKPLFMSVVMPDGGSDRFSFHLPMPFFIANIGESYAAGLGTGQYDLVRGDEVGSYRSSLSGPELVMAYLQEHRPEYAIEYINVAYAGARLRSSDGSEDKEVSSKKFSSTIIDDEDGQVVYGSQLKQVSAWLANHPLKPASLDYAFLSIGGNDMFENAKGGSGLANLMKQAFLHAHFEEDSGKRIEKIKRGLTQFSDELAAMAELIQQSDDFKHTRFIYSTIPDSTKNDSGVTYGSSDQGWMKKYTAAEMKMIFCKVLLPMNNLIRDFCGQHEHFVLNDVQDKALRHGVVSRDPWFNHLESINNRGEHLKKEAFHPNQTGQCEIYYKTLKPKLLQLLSR